MTNRFLISVAAAALIASTGLANAQGAGGGMNQGGGAGGSTAQQGGGASERGAPSAAPSNRDSGPSGGMKDAQSDKMEGTKSKSAQDDMKGQKSQQNTADTDRKGGKEGGKDMKAEGRDGKDRDSKDKVGQSRDQDRMGKDSDRTKAQGQDRDRADTKDTKGGAQTTGQAGAGAKLSTEQQTKITTVIKQQNVAPVTNVNFSISVGTRVPRDVRFHSLPAEVVTIYPQWRGYNYILVREEIIIIDPNTFEIVAVINA